MKTKTSALKLLVLVTFISVFFSLSKSSKAQESQPTGLLFSPPIVELTVEKGKSYDQMVKLENKSTQVRTFYLQAMDFISKGEEGGQEFVLPEDESSKTYSLASWFVLPSSSLTLQPGETTATTVTLKVPENAEAGGRYAAVFFTTLPPAITEGVSIATKTGPIFLVRVAGPVQEKGMILEFNADKGFYEHAPVQFLTRFANNGNVHLKPYGEILVKNLFGNVSGRLVVNEKAGNILPNSVRKFENTWEGKRFLLGKFSAELVMNFGEGNLRDSRTISFWIIPYKELLVIALALLIIIALLVLGVKRYNAWIIAKATKKEKDEVKVKETNSQDTSKSSKDGKK